MRELLEKKERHQRKAINNIIANSKSSQQLLENAYVEIDEDWTNEVGVEDFPGNIYSIWAFSDDESLCSNRSGYQDWLQILACRAGFICIFIIQFVAPPAIFMSTVFSWGILSSERIKWEEWQPSVSDWRRIGLTKFLGVIFVFMFCLNGFFVLFDEFATYHKVDWLFRTLNKKNPSVVLKGESGIAVGIMVNCWVVTWCCLDSFVVCGTSFSPAEVVYDSLGLIFLFNLDDIGGDLGFVGAGEWPHTRLAWMYKWLKQEEKHAEAYGAAGDEDGSFYDSCQDWVVKFFYGVSMFFGVTFVFLLPIMTAITPFLAIASS